jgi:hypothetical protein
MQAPGPLGPIPQGFTRLFNGQNLAGWHISMTNHHGRTSEWRVNDGVLTATQNPPGVGGILLSDQIYRDFEVYLQIRPDWGCDGGLFLRSNADGHAYQVLIDYLQGGNIGGVYLEKLGGKGFIAPDYPKHWKKDDWNTLRARIEGAPPRIVVWLNERQVMDWTDTETRRSEGHIALQVHRGVERWAKGGFHRYRDIAVRVLR